MFLFASSCGWLTGPDDEEVDPRTFTWTVDTLAYPGSLQTHMLSIWGSSPNDVYVVGHNERGYGKMYHFNGNEWSDVGLNPIQGGYIVGPITLEAIHGVATDDIWAVGERRYDNPDPPPNYYDSSLVIHYDGIDWREVETPSGRVLQAIGGRGPNDLWAGGLNVTLFHYDGTTWEKRSIGDTLQLLSYPQFRSFVSDGNQVYSLLYKGGGSNTYYVLQLINGEWRLLDDLSLHTGFLWMSSSGSLYATGPTLQRREQGHWQDTFESRPDSVLILRADGIDDDNLFAVGYSQNHFVGMVYHYNGTDWYQVPIPQIYPVHLGAVWTDGREVFVQGILSNYPQSTVILHGR
ncbi:MAG: hypothetical protein JSW54_06245 [Fidelibacterota bacterium]|nr:MAG: hypothetical protein JSW54_06245 [Candidatus Neomarinimicrobiota bacterium]